MACSSNRRALCWCGGDEMIRGAVKVAGRGFLVGVGLHLGQQLVRGVASGKILAHPAVFLRYLPLVDCVRFASFIAAAGSTYKLTLSLLRQAYNTDNGWPAVVAGCAAGLTSLIDDPSRRRTLSLFILARALGALVLTLHRRGKLPTVPYFVVLAFGVCESLIIYSTVHYPTLLPRSYYTAILSWSRYFTEDKLKLFFRVPSLHFLPCSAGLHPGSCNSYALTDFFHSLFLYIKIYLSIYSLPLVLFRTKSLWTHTITALRTLLNNTLVSALFLAVDGALVKYTLCLLRNGYGHAPPLPAWIALLSGFLGAAGLLIERHSRRLELLYYVLPQVLYGVWRVLCIKKPLNLHKIPCGSVWVFCASLAVIFHSFEREHLSLSPLINTALHRLLDT
ncbi:uncharacterized protein LOC135344449 isoform X2 [Halichondria panicea]|uniref:uncharacterized protein LOC135344449 isoform X2 n=1 Tax=Halichondria panicea TaxID=6063 RepID=UPI00312BBF62